MSKTSFFDFFNFLPPGNSHLGFYFITYVRNDFSLQTHTKQTNTHPAFSIYKCKRYIYNIYINLSNDILKLACVQDL